MNLYVLGATGRVGRVIVGKALADGHEVSALVRSVAKVGVASERLVVWEGDVLQEEDVVRSMAGSEVVICALNTDQNRVLSRSMPLILGAMREHGISRIVTIGTAGILESRSEPGKYRFQSSESKRRSTTAAEDHRVAYELLAESGFDWTVVCPTYLPDGEEEGDYRVEVDFLPESAKRITVGDTAAFAYSVLLDGGFVGTRVGIGY